MKVLVVLLVAFSIISIAVTREDVLNASREDIDKAIKLLKVYIAQHPDENVEDLGKFVYTKKRLSRDPDIGEAVLKEDFNSLLKGLVEKGSVDLKLYEDLKAVFDFDGELAKRLGKLDENAVKVCEMVGRFTKVDCSPLARALVERYIEDPVGFDPRPYMTLACIDPSELKTDISNAMENLFEEKGEDVYMKLWSLSELLGIDFPHSGDLKEYASVAMDVENALAKGASSETIASLRERIGNLKIEKGKLLERLGKVRIVETPKNPEKAAETVKRPIYVYVAVTAVSTAVFLIIFLLLDSRSTVRRLKRKIERDPLNPDLHVKLAEIYERLGRIEDAMEEYRIASKLEKERKEPPEGGSK